MVWVREHAWLCRVVFGLADQDHSMAVRFAAFAEQGFSVYR
jgi:hypothetical protein